MRTLLHALGGLIGQRFRQLDYWLAIPYGLLSLVGILMSLSTIPMSTAGGTNFNIMKQAIFAGVGFAALLLIYLFKPHRPVRSHGWLFAGLLGVGILLVWARLAPAVNGAHGWISMMSITLQPAEFLKFGIIIYMAYWLSQIKQRQSRYRTASSWYRLAVWLIPGLCLLLVASMPDFGNLAITLVITFVIVLASGVKPAVVKFAAGIAFTLFVSLSFLARLIVGMTTKNGGSMHYTIARFVGFVDPWLNADIGRQLIYGYYAIANGGLFGVGLGRSMVKQFLPESNTDFVIAVVTEELGSVTTIVLLCVMFILISRLIALGIRQKHQRERLFLYGLAAWLFMQMFVNVGGVLGLLPITGVVFPFVSAGGSSFVVLSFALGIALAISARDKMLAAQSAKRGEK